MTEPEIPLPGGDVTQGVVRVGATVRRPVGAHSPLVHRVLRHLDADGNVVDVEMNAYQLARDDEGWTIAVTTPLEPH